jgi:hypothetical protein
MNKAVKGLYQKYADATATISRGADEVVTTKAKQEEEEEVNEFQSFRHISKNFKPRKKAHVKDEYDSYISELPEEKNQLISNPLEWWNVNGWKYPILQKMADDLFFIPCMSSVSRNKGSQLSKDCCVATGHPV